MNTTDIKWVFVKALQHVLQIPAGKISVFLDLSYFKDVNHHFTKQTMCESIVN